MAHRAARTAIPPPGKDNRRGKKRSIEMAPVNGKFNKKALDYVKEGRKKLRVARKKNCTVEVRAQQQAATHGPLTESCRKGFCNSALHPV